MNESIYAKVVTYRGLETTYYLKDEMLFYIDGESNHRGSRFRNLIELIEDGKHSGFQVFIDGILEQQDVA